MNSQLLYGLIPIFIFSIHFSPIPLNSQSFGTKGHPMHKLTPNIEVLSYWNNVPAQDVQLYQTALNVLSKDENASYNDLIEDKVYKDLIQEQGRKILGGPMLGNLSDSGVDIWLRTSREAKVQVQYTNGNESLVSEASYTSADTDLTSIIRLRNINTSESYTYKILIDDSISIMQNNFVFGGLENNLVRIAFGSCPHRWGLGNDRLFQTIESRSPDAMFLLGDIAVQDRYRHLGMHRADYLLRDFQNAWSTFTPSIPVYANWDDHDYFGNDEAGIPEGYNNEDRINVRKIFKNSWANPSYGLESSEEGIFFKTSIGKCDFIMTDNRFFRSGQKGSFLGDKQMLWLKEQIIRASGSFIVISCGTMWSDFVSNGKDSWGVNDPDGREEIFSLIEQKGISGVLFISGDRHGARGFTIERSSGFKFYEFEAASLGSRVGPSKSKPEWNTQLYGIDDTFAFGELTFNTTEGRESVTYRLIEENGEILYTNTLGLAELTPIRH